MTRPPRRLAPPLILALGVAGWIPIILFVDWLLSAIVP
jgi:hypothetical protein